MMFLHNGDSQKRTPLYQFSRAAPCRDRDFLEGHKFTAALPRQMSVLSAGGFSFFSL